MTLRFSEKLGFLMDVTKTTNSALSLYVSLDASYISRLRSGKRLAPRNENIIRRMAAYFARNCSEEYRKKTLEDVLGIHPLPGDKNALAEAIALWLLKEKESGADTVGRFLGSLAELQGRKEQSEKPEKKERPYPRDETAVYYGVEGKRQAVLYFLSEVLTQEKAQTLFLFSDEETSWMTADPGFTEKWAGLMTSILSSGHRIKIIHTVSRDLNEMLSAIGQWMPLYMTGSIEPFFYPKKRDGVFHHTLFIARGTAAVVSGSVGGNTKRAVNMLFRSAETVSSFEEEFLQYLALCRPLMRAIKAGDTADCLNLLSDFERKQHNTILKTETLSLLTFPEAGVSELFKRGGFDSDRMLEYHRTRIERFRRLVQDVRFDEIIALPEPNDVIAGKIPVALSALLQGGLIYYTPEEYISHLTNISLLLETSAHYHVHLIKRRQQEGHMVYVKKERGVIVAKTSQPPVVLSMTEENITAAFRDYLADLAGTPGLREPDNRNTARRIRAYVRLLKAAAGMEDKQS